MSEIKEKAVKKIEKEIEELNAKSDKEYREIEVAENKEILNWICTQNDKELLNGIVHENKSLFLAKQFAYSKAISYQVRGMAVVQGDIYLSWLTEYYKNPVVIATKGKVVSEKNRKKVKRIDETKSSKENKAKCINTVKKVERPKNDEPKGKMMEGEQLDLLAFL
jgi:hypothetical protein